MQDPVSGFTYPKPWMDRCADPESLELVQQGLAILTADGSVRKRGFTTGTTVAAAVKAAVLSLNKKGIRSVSIMTPARIRVSVPVLAQKGIGRCNKYSGDYPGDVTAALEFMAVATPHENLDLLFGEGIGRWERDTPRYHKGESAVSIQAMEEIRNALYEALQESGMLGAHVQISAPHGAEIAKKTLNQKVGVSGGISVLGTTGFVEPWDDHLEESVCSRAVSAEHVVLTTGRMGMKFSRLIFPDHEVILAGSRLSSIIPHLNGDIIICGLPALVLKYINPHILDDTGIQTIEEMIDTPLFKPAMEAAFESYKREHPDIRVVIVNREGAILGDSG